MKIERYQCPLCDWKHEEVDVPRNLLRGFSEPLALANIMLQQKNDRIETALSEHLATHTTPQWLQKVSSLQWELARLKATFP